MRYMQSRQSKLRLEQLTGKGFNDPKEKARTNANANRKVDWQQTRAQVARAMHRLVASGVADPLAEILDGAHGANALTGD